MAVELAEGVVVLRADGSDIPRQIRSGIEGGAGDFDGAGRNASGVFGGAFSGSFLGTIVGSLATSVVAGIGEAVGAGLRTAVQYGFDSVGIASDLAETRSAVNTVFGDSAPGIQAWASQGAAALGQTQQGALNAAQTFGVYGTAAGLAGDDLTNFTTNLGDLATDFSSFYNTSPEEAVEAIGAGLRGEAEPLRRFGVMLDDATLKSKAMELGIYDGTGSLTQQQRVLAAQASIMGQAGAAAGDFDRTSGGLANQQRILQSNLEDTQAKLGEALLPAFTDLVTFANDSLIPILGDVMEQIGPELGQALTDAAPALMDLAEMFIDYLPTFVEWGSAVLPGIVWALQIFVGVVTWLTDVTSGVIDIVGLFFGLLSGNVSADEAGARLEGATGVFGFFGDVVFAVAGFFQGAMTWIGEAANNTGSWITDVWNGVVGFFQSIPGRIQSFFGGIGGWLFSAGQSLIQGFVDGIQGMVGAVGDAVGSVLDWAASFFPHSPAERGPFSGSGWTAIGESGAAVMTAFTSGFARPDLSGALAPLYGSLTGPSARGGMSGSVGYNGGGMSGVSDGRAINVDLTVRSDDPELAGRQFARALARKL